MTDIKTKEEITIMLHGGKILANVLREVQSFAKPGVSELELDTLAEKLIRKLGGEPGFKKVPGYKHTVCMSTNGVVVHGVPSAYILKEGDVVGIDCGVYYKGFHTDMSETLRVSSQKSKVKSQKSDEIDNFLETGKRALNEAIKVARVGNRIGHISKAIQDTVEGRGYSVVRSLVGHGVGRQLHEEPEVPGYLVGDIKKTPLLSEGMTIAVEVIYNMGKKEVMYANDDGWSVKTADGSISGLFERTIALTKEDALILTE